MKKFTKSVGRMLHLMALVMLIALGLPAALSADAEVARKDSGLQSFPVAGSSTQIYKGAHVCLNSSGYLVPAADTAGYRYVGVAAENVLNTGSDGDYSCKVYTMGRFLCTCTSITQTMVGTLLYVTDDATLDDSATNYICAGRLVEYVSATSGWVDIAQRGMALDGAGDTIHMAITGEGYSLNLISVTSTCTSGEGTRGLRVNLTTSDAIASGDLQCFHGYLTLGSGASLANNAAVYPLSGWLDIPDGTSIGTGCIVAGCRVIVDPNNNDMSALGGGGESALFYGQTWASTGALEHGLRVVAGAGTTIKNAISVGGTGTFNKVVDLSDWDKDTVCILVQGGPKDATETAQWVFAIGDAASHAAIVAELGGTAYGSMYASTAGKLWVNESGTWTAQN